MLTSINRMIGLPVVWQDRQLGQVERAVPDLRNGWLDGMVVRKGIGAARWISRDAVLLAGESCVILNRKPVRMPEQGEEPVGRVFLTTGECVGGVTDAVLDGHTLRIAALEVCQGPLDLFRGRRYYADSYRVSSAQGTAEVVVPRLLSWMQLLRQSGEEDEV